MKGKEWAPLLLAVPKIQSASNPRTIRAWKTFTSHRVAYANCMVPFFLTYICIPGVTLFSLVRR